MSCRRRIKRARTMADAAAALPDELVIEILSRLPTKSLARFQSVSKNWRSFISYVSTSQRRILAPSLSGFFFYYPGDFFQGIYESVSPHPDDFPSRFAGLPFNSPVRVIHSCNGLVLLNRNHLTASSLYYVWNPTTMELVALPELPRSGIAVCFLAFHPCHFPHYAVVRFMTEHYAGRLTVQIYSSITGTWADHQPSNHPTLPIQQWDRSSVFHNGALYFLAGTRHLVSFHIQQKRFHTIILPVVRPPDPFGLSTTTCIGESNDQLYYAVNLVKPCQLHIYMLLDEDYKWLLTHEKGTHFLNHHPLTCDPSCEIPPTHYLQPLAFHPESKVIYLSLRSKIISYHPTSGKMEEVCKLSDDKCTFHWSYFFSIIHCQQSICTPTDKFIKQLALEYVNASA